MAGVGRIEGKNAIVTGAASGIGLATAQRFIAEGARVAAADVNADALEAAWRDADPDALRTFVVDVADRESVDRFVDEAAAWLGGVDILVNSAGTIGEAPTLEMDEDEWDRVVDVNLKGTFLVSQRAGRKMRETGGGAMVHVSSVAAEQANPYHPHYAASKGGVRQLTKALAVGLAEFNIRSNAVGPGPILTGMGAGEFRDPEREARLLRRVLRGRVGRPEDVAAAILFLASDEADFVNGTTLYVDGGVLATR
jgi:NAD(P)-dependent dehydrogenase (short-subunit alcohol dehydrogenase family)